MPLGARLNASVRRRKDEEGNVLALAIALVAGAPGVTVNQPAEGPVWSWFATCAGPVLMVDLMVDQTSVLEATVPICHQERGGSAGQGQSAGQIQFTFRPKRSIVWSGYREHDDVTAANAPLEAVIWQAGSDPDDLIIGITVADAKKNVMHALHMASPNVETSTTLAKGVVLRTHPEKSPDAK